MNSTLIKTLLSSGIALAIAGCGGGGGDTTATTTAGTTADSRSITLSGTAATGMAIQAASVNVRCQSGAATTTTNADGMYTVTIDKGEFPCMVQTADPSDGAKYHSIAISTNTSAIANLTPLSEALVARVMHKDLTAFFTAFDPAYLNSTATASAIQTAHSDLAVSLANIIDMSAVANVLSIPLKAATTVDMANGDVQAMVLNTFRTRLTREQFVQYVNALASGISTANVKDLVSTFEATVLPNGHIVFKSMTWMPNALVKTGSNLGARWDVANNYCASSIIDGKTGWRLPTRDEVVQFASSTAVRNAITANSALWSSDWVWSSTANGTGMHYTVNLLTGEPFPTLDTNALKVTCVR